MEMGATIASPAAPNSGQLGGPSGPLGELSKSRLGLVRINPQGLPRQWLRRGSAGVAWRTWLRERLRCP